MFDQHDSMFVKQSRHGRNGGEENARESKCDEEYEGRTVMRRLNAADCELVLCHLQRNELGVSFAS